jgi:carbamoyltransferase
MGWGVDNGDHFSDILEAKYVKLDVMNFALSGTGTDQQLLIYEHIAKPYEADAYIFAPCTLDITRNMLELMPGRSKSRIIYYPKPYFTLENGDLKLHNVPVPKKAISDKDAAKRADVVSDFETSPYTKKITMILPQWIKQSRLFEQITIAIRGPYREYESNTDAWTLMLAIFLRFIKQVNGKPVFIIPLPTYHHIEMNLPSTYLTRFAELNKHENNCFVVDVLPYFKRLSLESRRACRLDNDPLHHYSPQGHKVIAEAISDSLAEHCPNLLN